MTDPDPLDPDRLVALISSRICHDLVNPLSAISNGVELLGMAPDGALGPEFDLIKDSVENANARVRFFRVAFGASADGDMLEASEIDGILSAMSKGMRQTFDWMVPEAVKRTEAKLCFLLIQCLETALPYGGAVRITREGPVWKLSAQAERFADIDALWRIITHADDAGNLPPAQVHFALTASEQDKQARRIDLVQDATSVNLTIRPA